MIRAFNLKFPSFVVHDFPAVEREQVDESTAEVPISSQEEEMVELEIDSDSSHPLWQALQDADFESLLLNHDEDDDEEMASIERALASSYMGVHRANVEEDENDERYLLNSSMRTSFCAHNLNLVVKSVLNSIDVSCLLKLELIPKPIPIIIHQITNIFFLFLTGSSSRSGEADEPDYR